MPTGWHINKKSTISTVSSDFYNNWDTVLSKEKKDLVQFK